MSRRVLLCICSQLDGARPLSAHTRSREMQSESLIGAGESHMFVLLRDATQFRAIPDGSSHRASPADHVSVAFILVFS